MKKTKKYKNNELLFKSKNIDGLYDNSKNFLYRMSYKYKNEQQSQEELFGICNVGFMKAYKSFTLEKNIKWLTYLDKVCKNEIFMSFRQTKKNKNLLYYEESFVENENGLAVNFIDLIPSDEDIENEYIEQEHLRLVYKSIDKLSLLQQDVFLLMAIGQNQKQIGEELGISQSYVSRIVKQIAKRMPNIMNNPKALSKECDLKLNKEEQHQLFSVIENCPDKFLSIEMTIVKLLHKNKTQKEIAELLSTTQPYVNVVIQRIYKKCKQIRIEQASNTTISYACKEKPREKEVVVDTKVEEPPVVWEFPEGVTLKEKVFIMLKENATKEEIVKTLKIKNEDYKIFYKLWRNNDKISVENKNLTDENKLKEKAFKPKEEEKEMDNIGEVISESSEPIYANLKPVFNPFKDITMVSFNIVYKGKYGKYILSKEGIEVVSDPSHYDTQGIENYICELQQIKEIYSQLSI